MDNASGNAQATSRTRYTNIVVFMIGGFAYEEVCRISRFASCPCLSFASDVSVCFLFSFASPQHLASSNLCVIVRANGSFCRRGTWRSSTRPTPLARVCCLVATASKTPHPTLQTCFLRDEHCRQSADRPPASLRLVETVIILCVDINFSPFDQSTSKKCCAFTFKKYGPPFLSAVCGAEEGHGFYYIGRVTGMLCWRSPLCPC